MGRSSPTAPNFRWSAVVRESDYDMFVTLDRASHEPHPGVVFFDPETSECLWSSGVWSKVNDAMGTSFDFAEEEVVSGDKARYLSDVLIGALSQVPEPMRPSIRAAAELLRESASRNEKVIIAL